MLPTEWKIVAKDKSDNGLIPKISKNSTSRNKTKTNNLIRKMGRGLKKIFSQRNIQMAHRYMRRCSRLLIIREMQVETTVRCHSSPVRVAVINKEQITSVGESVGKKEHSYTIGGNIN